MTLTIPQRLARGHTVACRAMLLDTDLSPLADLSVLGGQVIGDWTSPIRRSGDATLADPDGSLIPYEAAALIQLGRPIRFEVGIYIDGYPLWTPVATLLPDDPVAETGTWALSIGGRDRLRLASESDLVEPITYWADTRIGDVIRAFAEAAGMGTDDALYDLDDAGKVLGSDATYEADRNRLDVMRQLASDNGLDLSCDALGILTLAPSPDPLTAPVEAVFGRGAGARLLGLRRGWQDQVKNHVVVVGDGVRSEAEVTDTASPIHKSRIGDRVYRYQSDGIVYQSQADDAAAAQLRKVALIQETLQLTVPPDPTLGPGSVIEVHDAQETKASGRYVVSGYTLPLDVTTMATIAVGRVWSLS